MIINYESLFFNYSLSVINYQLLIVHYSLSTINYQLLIINYWLWIINYWLLLFFKCICGVWFLKDPIVFAEFKAWLCFSHKALTWSSCWTVIQWESNPDAAVCTAERQWCLRRCAPWSPRFGVSSTRHGAGSMKPCWQPASCHLHV